MEFPVHMYLMVTMSRPGRAQITFHLSLELARKKKILK